MPALTAVTLPVIERIFEILDRLGISREAVVIPLKPAHPGTVSVLPNGKTQIVVESETPLDAWLPELETRLQAMMAGIDSDLRRFRWRVQAGDRTLAGRGVAMA
jgi:hypothetical protein